MTSGLRFTNFLTHSMGFAIVVALAIVFSAPADVQADEVLTIGDKAPALDIEHWLSDRDGEFSGFDGFEKDKVYIVEFWATWCGPCISSMPHIVEIQNEYADKGVQVISVSREDLETVEKFLKRKVRGEKKKTYAELTSAYCLTTDPDGSVNKDYMKAAAQGGIPTAFIVGKTGEIEWIGHPARMDKPLEEIVEGKYDRDAFAKEFAKKQESDLMMASISNLMRDGKAEEALKKVDAFIENADDTTPARAISRMKSMRNSIAMEVGGEVAVEAYKAMLESAGDDPRRISRLTSTVIKIRKAGDEIDDQIVELACEAAAKAVKLAEEDGKDKATARALNTHANLLYLCEKLEDAIAVQEKAVELSEDKQNVKFLDKLKKEFEQSKG